MNDTSNSKNNKTNKVTVDIYGVSYPLKGVTDVQHVKDLAKMVDERMRLIAKQNQYLPPDRIAVLAALYIAEQYVNLKKDYDEFWNILEENRSHSD